MAHKLTTQDQWFLDFRRHDPLQLSEFKIGDEVVVCKKCKCVQTYDSWEFNENKCLLCGHPHYTFDFSREYIDISYHREKRGSKLTHGFKVVDSDIKARTDKIRTWFSKERISYFSKLYIGFYIIMILLIIGLAFYQGHDSINSLITSEVLPLWKYIYTKLRVIPINRLSKIAINVKLSSLDFHIDRLIEKFSFIHRRLILLTTGLLYIKHKAIDSFTQIDWKGKQLTLITNFHTLIDYITRFFKR